jgi:HAE1 family hydrophobic/amphiphilic exporter-1
VKFSLPEFALKRPITVIMISISMLVVGTIAWFSMPLTFLPRIDQPFIGVSIPYPSASPEQVEQQIAIPVEGEFRTIPGLRRIRTISDSNGCFVSMLFSLDTDMNAATSDVRDRMERLKLVLPTEADKMLIQRFSSRTIPVMAVGIFRDGDQEEFVHQIRTIFEPRIRRIDGVAAVEILSPIKEKEVVVEFEQDVLRSMNLGLAEVIGALQQSSLNISIGQLTDEETRFFVRVEGEYRRIEEIENLVVAPNGMRLKEAAKVRYTERGEFGRVSLDGKGGAVLLMTKESEANTVATCRAVAKEIDKLLLEPMFKDVQLRTFFNQADLISTALSNLRDSGLYGGVMAIIILFFFLHRVRPTLIVALSIPCSLVVVFVFMFFMGMSLNLVTMVSMIISVGMLVDNGIVVVENIIRHRQMGHGPRESALLGSSEVSLAILGSTATTWVVFIPMYFLETGKMSVFMEQLGLPLIVGLGGSLVIALTLVPLVMSRMGDPSHDSLFHRLEHLLHRRRTTQQPAAEGATPAKRGTVGKAVSLLARINLQQRAIAGYGIVLTSVLRQRFVSMTVLALVLLVTYAIPYQAVGMRELPKLDTREVKIDIEVEQNYGEEKVQALFAKVEEQINEWREELGVKSILTFYEAGGGVIEAYLFTEDDDPKWKHPPYDTEQVMQIMTERLPALVPAAKVSLSMTDDSENGGGQAVSLSMHGDDTRRLEEFASQFRDIVAGLPDLSDVKTDVERSEEEVQLAIDEALANRAGVAPVSIAQTVEAALRGSRLPFLKQGGREVPVWAQFREEDRQSRANLENVTVMGAAGDLVPLNQLVDFSKARTAAAIHRLDSKNVVTITAKSSTDDLASVQRNLRMAADNFNLPPGYTIRFGQELEELGENFVSFSSTLLMAVILIYLVMASLFESYLLPLSIMTTVPLALAGGIWMLYFTGTQLDTVTLIGNVLMSGLIVNNGIVIVDHINDLRKINPDKIQAIVQAGVDRFRPVMMTALTTILGLVPLAMAKTGGAATFAGLGRALIGGLTTGTILTLVVVPLFYILIDDFQLWCRHYISNLRGMAPHKTTPDTQEPAPAPPQ